MNVKTKTEAYLVLAMVASGVLAASCQFFIMLTDETDEKNYNNIQRFKKARNISGVILLASVGGLIVSEEYLKKRPLKQV